LRGVEVRRTDTDGTVTVSLGVGSRVAMAGEPLATAVAIRRRMPGEAAVAPDR